MSNNTILQFIVKNLEYLCYSAKAWKAVLHIIIFIFLLDIIFMAWWWLTSIQTCSLGLPYIHHKKTRYFSCVLHKREDIRAQKKIHI